MRWHTEHFSPDWREQKLTHKLIHQEDITRKKGLLKFRSTTFNATYEQDFLTNEHDDNTTI